MTLRVSALFAAFVAFVVSLALLGAGAGPALATPHGPAIELTIIHATQSDAGGGIDPLLRDLPQLTRDQPFVRYNTYKVLGRQALPLEVGKPATSDLPNGRALAITLVDPPDAASAKAPRYHVRAEIGEPGKKAFLKLLEVTASGNEPFFVGGQSYQGGTLFLELVVRP